jgi:glycosyltransferase involved in cell wall biosynthesis
VATHTEGQPKKGPRISVVIPLYNHEKYIEAALCSVLNQTIQDFEIIIVNDGSTDKSEEVVKSVVDERIRYYYQENQGAHEAINRGVQLARGEFVSILNSDDEYDRARLEECLSVLGSDPSVDAVFSHVEFIDGEGKFVKYVRGAEENWANHDPATSFKSEQNIVLDLLAGNFLTTTSNLFCRRGVFDRFGYFSPLRYAHDYDFFLRLCSHEKVFVIEKPILKYRVHALNTVKENNAAVSYEVGLALTNLLLSHKLDEILGNGVQKRESRHVMMQFYNSLNTHGTERMIMILLLFSLHSGEHFVYRLASLAQNHDNPFRNRCIEDLNKSFDGWALWRETNDRLVAREHELREGWIEWQRTNERIVVKDQELQDAVNRWQETNKRLREAEQALREAEQALREKVLEITNLKTSKSFRLGRALTWPIRKLRDGMRQK